MYGIYTIKFIAGRLYVENEVTHTDVRIYYLAGFFYST